MHAFFDMWHEQDRFSYVFHDVVAKRTNKAEVCQTFSRWNLG